MSQKSDEKVTEFIISYEKVYKNIVVISVICVEAVVVYNNI